MANEETEFRLGLLSMIGQVEDLKEILDDAPWESSHTIHFGIELQRIQSTVHRMLEQLEHVGQRPH